MQRLTALTVLSILPLGGFAQPVRPVWIRSAAPAGATRAVASVLPDVHSVEFTATHAVVRSAGISLANLGPLGISPQPPGAVRQFEFRLPLSPQPGKQRHVHVAVLNNLR